VKVDASIATPAKGRPVNILGLSVFYHDSAACLVRDGQIIAAAQEERFTRKKHDAAFPSRLHSAQLAAPFRQPCFVTPGID
jgi:predicted NodU family carbamoyl transferase